LKGNPSVLTGDFLKTVLYSQEFGNNYVMKNNGSRGWTYDLSEIRNPKLPPKNLKWL
jgi:hypothetical protein